MKYGYVRCSTNSNKQDIDCPRRELILIGIKKEKVKQGDTIACTEVSRLSRSTKQLCEILEFVESGL